METQKGAQCHSNHARTYDSDRPSLCFKWDVGGIHVAELCDGPLRPRDWDGIVDLGGSWCHDSSIRIYRF